MHTADCVNRYSTAGLLRVHQRPAVGRSPAGSLGVLRIILILRHFLLYCRDNMKSAKTQVKRHSTKVLHSVVKLLAIFCLSAAAGAGVTSPFSSSFAINPYYGCAATGTSCGDDEWSITSDIAYLPCCGLNDDGKWYHCTLALEIYHSDSDPCAECYRRISAAFAQPMEECHRAPTSEVSIDPNARCLECTE